MFRFVFIFLLLVISNLIWAQTQLFQVISSHPHDVKEFIPYISKTVLKDGRLWLVELKAKVPASIKKHFCLTTLDQVKTYMPDTRLAKVRIPSPLIADNLSKINVSQIKSDVEWLSSYRTRAQGTEDNKKAETWIYEEFNKLGYKVTRYCHKPDACSVVADKVGDQKPQDVLLIMAHFDSVGRNFAGADDNASGTAVLIEVARALRNTRTSKTVRFFATNGEELGLLGAESYARELASKGEISRIKFAINMDMVGYNSNGIVELETNQEYEELANWYAGLVSQYTALTPKITLGAWGSDHVPFLKRKVPTVLTIEDWNTKTPCYHTECDKPETLNFDYAGEIAKLNLAAILMKDKSF